MEDEAADHRTKVKKQQVIGSNYMDDDDCCQSISDIVRYCCYWRVKQVLSHQDINMYK